MINLDYKVLIINMKNNFYLDAGGVHSLEQLYTKLKSKGIVLILANLNPQPFKEAIKTGLIIKIGNENVYTDFKEALIRAKEIIGKNTQN